MQRPAVFGSFPQRSLRRALFAGNGANMALRDGLELAEHLLSSQHASLEAAVAAHDAQSGPRVRTACMQGRWNLAVSHKQGWSLVGWTVLLYLIGCVFAARAWWRSQR